MRPAQMIEEELIEISGLADDLVKFERIVAWCATHPDEVPFAMHHLMRQRRVPATETSQLETPPDQL